MVILRPEFSSRDSQYQIPPDILSQLRQTPWCASILDNPTSLSIQLHSRSPSPHLVGRYSFMSRTLLTAETVPVWQGFYRPSSHSDPTDNDCGEVRVLVMLGSGMDGHLRTAHSGVAATLLDETMGTVGGIRKTPGKVDLYSFHAR